MTDTQAPIQRIAAIDVLRGLVIVLMALDHIRDYMHISGYAINPLDPKQTTPLLYATRWVTHFCAPTFVFLSGVSSRLQIKRGMTQKQVSWRLLTRGLWLVALELTIISFAWAWSFPYMIFLQVIFAIGVSMVILSALIFLPRAAVLLIGAAIIISHSAVSGLDPKTLGAFGPVYQLGFQLVIAPPGLFGAYPVIPWLGIMALGYGLGSIFVARDRDRTLMILGGAMIVLFLLLRGFNLPGNPTPWIARESLGDTIMAFLDVRKQPPSPQYVLATLGPVLLAFPLLARLPASIAGFFRTYGAVPLMAYVAHIYAVHAVAHAARLIAGESTAGMHNTIYNFVFDQQAMGGNGLPLWSVYVGWMVVLVAIYPLCRWWAHVKRTRRDWWLSYM
jgi:uncharacterized membrane protein